jgi:hypothetical protein
MFGLNGLRNGAPKGDTPAPVGQSGAYALPLRFSDSPLRSYPLTLPYFFARANLTLSHSFPLTHPHSTTRPPVQRTGYTEGWAYHGDDRLVFRNFFGGENPFDDLFPKKVRALTLSCVSIVAS